MQRTLIFTTAALLALAACSTEPTVVTANTSSPDPMADELAKAPPVELPPPLEESHTFRCADNSLVYVDFFKGGTQANVKAEKNGVPTVLKAPAAGEAFVADGYSLTGSGKAITLAQPGKAAQSCKA